MQHAPPNPSSSSKKAKKEARQEARVAEKFGFGAVHYAPGGPLPEPFLAPVNVATLEGKPQDTHLNSPHFSP